ncbi:SPOR domain-containing protein [Aestuariivirga sp.]|uniref:SPOR domain-containing protein n=1 Tax=Aestuariivirga sp. TaxID=2650926 RepID=UPI0035B43929
MDQDSSNGAGPDKRNWRERLGIGAKELPKLSDEFRDDPQIAAPPPPAGTARPAPRAPVTKPAPMAPRVAPRPAPAAAEASAAPAPAPAVPPALSRATPKGPDNAAQDALAEKLRAQRAAAERLAEQRVQAARSRAEGKKPELPPPARPTTPPPRPAAATGRTQSPPPLGGTPRPKFSFADENRPEGAGARPGIAPPLTPPRPALGGERATPPFLRPGTGANGSLGARPSPAFRSPGTEGSAGYTPSPRLQAPGSRPGLGTDPAGYGASRLPVRRSPALDPYARQPQPEPREFGDDDLDEDGRAAPRLGRPTGRARSQDDFDEVFEDDQPAPRSRATARDYQSSYDEGEEGFADERRRSSGPWLLLLALLAAAVLTGGVVWYFSDSVKHLAGVGSSSGSTPVISSPTEPAKMAAPDANGDGQTEAPAARKKQIYDRIVGEQEVTGEMQPTEETPVTPEAAQPDAGQPAAGAQPASGTQPADQVPKIEPAGNANQIPAPDAPDQGATGQGLPDPEPPPPLPIPGSDQQGNLGLKGGAQVAAASAQPDQGAAAPPPLPSSSALTSSSDANTPPPPEKATDGAALVSGGGSAAKAAAGTTASATPEPVVTPQPDTQITAPAPSTDQSDAQPAPPPKKKTAAKKTATKQAASKQTDYDNLGSKPVVLVPPSQQAAAQSQSASGVSQPVTPEQPVATAPNPQKRKTIFDLFNGGNGTSTNIPVEPAAPTQVASAATQTKQAATPSPAPKATTQAAPPAAAPSATGGGYVIQLASFRTDLEAKKEYSRLAGAYPSIVGPLKSQIRQATVGGSTRYQLGLGPLPTRGDATRVCGELIAAGESDCIVRGP